MNVATGVAPLDERIAGLRQGGTYLLTGGDDTAKLAFMLQVLDTGLRNGERVALLSAATPDDILEQAGYFGFDIASHWHDGSCILLGFKGQYPRRVVHAPDPADAFAELASLVDPPVERIAVDPGSFLWSTRAGTAMAQGFVEWAEGTGATVVASVAAGLADRPDPSTEWVLQRAAGVLHFARLSSGIHEIEFGRFSPPVETPGPVSLELRAGEGLVAPTGRVERRSSDRRAGADAPLVLVELGAAAPSDLVAWLGRDRRVERIDDGMALVRRLQSSPAGLVCVYVDRSRTDEAVEMIRASRPLSAAPVLVLSDHELRSGDRTAALDAGADDVLSGGIDLKELDARIRRARESDRRGPGADPPDGPMPVDGLLETSEFETFLEARLDADENLFSLLRFDLPGVPDLGSVLVRSVRTESGDLVARVGDGHAVLLQDARAQQAEGFLRRVQTELRRRGHTVPLEVEILSSPEQAEEIRRLIGV